MVNDDQKYTVDARELGRSYLIFFEKSFQRHISRKFIDIYELRNGEELGVLKVWEPKNDLVFGQYEIRGKVKTYKDETYIEVILIFFSVHNSLLQF